MKTRMNYLAAGMLAVMTLMSLNAVAQKNRQEIPDKYKWNLGDLYKSDDDWAKDRDAFKVKVKDIENFKGTLTRSPADLKKWLLFTTEIFKDIEKLYAYASLNSDLDTRNMKYSGMAQELQQIFSELSARMAFADPELLSSDWEKIDGFIKTDPELSPYRMGLENLFRMKKHMLSEQEEKLLALASMVTGVPGSVYNTFSNAEMPAPEVTLSDGKKISITQSEYNRYRTLPDRGDREKVFSAFWNNWENYKASYGEMLYGSVNKDIFYARARKYSSAVEGSLYVNNIPVEVYKSLIENVNRNLPAFHRYLAIKKRMLGVDTLKYSDMYAPVVKNIDLKYSYEEASKIVLEALKPLGDDYVATVRKAIDSRWIDVYPAPGKQSGAFSSGLTRELHPYILMNFTEIYSDVSTMAHELGHTMQSYLSNNKQPYPLAGYPLFVAEVASTFNEVLLNNYMISQVKDDDTRLSILMNWLDNFKGTLFRQTQFAEFELKIHEAAEQGNPLTGDDLSRIYMDILKSYYGTDKGLCKLDKNLEMEWAFIPHFYSGFYVYQYSTSFTASIALAEKVMGGDKEALKKYLTFISSGGSEYPIDLLKKAGADLTTNDPFDMTIKAMNKVMDEIEKILDKKSKK
ncbi:MAG TPA: oligoendopeptidase F [Bacteroidales bacterium]|nr:oligoendopeptidase F [Bacteroidales bacterium]